VAVARLAVLASGTGSIAEAILAAALPVEMVLADRTCPALAVAERRGTRAVLVQRASFGTDFDRLGYTEHVVDVLRRNHISAVAMAGFMTVLSAPMFDVYGDRVYNTHPSLLPAFPGAHAVRDALAFGVKVTGCTVHVATLTVDAGPIVAQECVPVLDGDDEATLHERIKTVERRLYPAALQEVLR
jgi:phosphoribosylglycinamide formyltransferase-1